MFGLTGPHLIYLIIFLAVVLIILGPGKLPDVGSGLGKAIREFRSASNDMKDHVVNATKHEDTPAATTPATPASPTVEVHPGAVVEPPQPVTGGSTSPRVGG